MLNMKLFSQKKIIKNIFKDKLEMEENADISLLARDIWKELAG
jgi:hypothetical protein